MGRAPVAQQLFADVFMELDLAFILRAIVITDTTGVHQNGSDQLRTPTVLGEIGKATCFADHSHRPVGPVTPVVVLGVGLSAIFTTSADELWVIPRRLTFFHRPAFQTEPFDAIHLHELSDRQLCIRVSFTGAICTQQKSHVVGH